jgi:hypothetical protein
MTAKGKYVGFFSLWGYVSTASVFRLIISKSI